MDQPGPEIFGNGDGTVHRKHGTGTTAKFDGAELEGGAGIGTIHGERKSTWAGGTCWTGLGRACAKNPYMTAHLFRLLGRFAVAAALLGMAALAACGRSQPLSSEIRPAPTGDLSSAALRALDPCALLPPAKLRRLHNAARVSLGERTESRTGEGEPKPPRVSLIRGNEFGTCQAMIPRRTPERPDPGFGYANVTLNLAAPRRERIGTDTSSIGHGFSAATTILAEPDKACGSVLFTPLGIPFELVTTSPSGELPASELCTVNREVRSIVVRQLAAGKTEKLVVDTPSLHTHSPCDVLQPSVQARWPQARLTPGTWFCEATAESPTGGADGSESVRVRFRLDERLGDDVSNPSPISVAGRPAVQTSPDAKTCRVGVRYGGFPGGLGRAIEAIEVVTTTKGDDPTVACQLAVSTAEGVLQQLS